MKIYSRGLVSLFIGAVLSLCLMSSTASAAWTTEVVDTGGVGKYPSLAFDPVTGYPCISYQDLFNGELEYASFNGTTWDKTTIDDGNFGADDVGRYSSLAFNPVTGYPAIAYRDDTNNQLRYARFNGTTWFAVIADDGDSGSDNVGKYCSLAFDASGKPGISYYNASESKLAYAYDANDNGDFAAGERELVGGGGQGTNTSLAFNPSTGYPAISFKEFGASDELGYTEYNGATWDQVTVDNGGGSNDVGAHSSLAFNPATGYPAIAHHDITDGDLEYAAWNGTSWDKTTIDNIDYVGAYCSLAFDPLGNPFISYVGEDGGPDKLKFASQGSPWSAVDVDTSPAFTETTSLAIDSMGNTGIAYYDSDNGELKYAYQGTSTPAGCGCPDDAIDPTGCISGKIKTKQGDPVSGKTVKLKKKRWPNKPLLIGTTTTDLSGCYTFSDLEDGTYNVSIKVTGCGKSKRKTRTVSGGAKVEKVNLKDFKRSCP